MEIIINNDITTAAKIENCCEDNLIPIYNEKGLLIEYQCRICLKKQMIGRMYYE